MAIGRQTMSYSYHIIGVQFPNSREYSVSPRWVMSSYKKREFQLCRNAKKPLHGVKKTKTEYTL